MVPKSTTATFQSLWLGTRLSPLEQLCITSFVAHRHKFILYSYADVENLPQGCELRDARMIVPEEGVFFHRSGIHVGSPAGFSDRFRYELLRRRGGWWVDTDVFCLKDDIPETPYAFAKQDEHLFNGAILKAPQDSDFLARALAHAAQAGNDIMFNAIGPHLVNQLVEELGLEGEAWSRDDFYVLSWDRVLEFLDPAQADIIEARTAASTFVHFSTSMLRLANVLKEVRPPGGSYLDRMYVAYDVDFPAHPRYEWADIEPQYALEKAHWAVGREVNLLRAELRQLRSARADTEASRSTKLIFAHRLAKFRSRDRS